MQLKTINKHTLVILVLLILVGCASRGSLTQLVADAPSHIRHAVTENIIVASSRKFDSDPAIFLSAGRAKSLKFAEFDISVPLQRPEGKIQWAEGAADPRYDFAVIRRQKLNGDKAFVAKLNQALAAKPARKKAIFVFIHGYNNNFAESLFRLAQLKKDASIDFVTVGYSWPSAGEGSRYAYDRDSVYFARDQLEHLLDLTARANTNRVYVLAHSLGSWLTMEAFRQARIGGKSRIFKKLKGLALAAPDIDVDVFETQIARLSPLPKPFYVLVSQKDNALKFLGYLTGDTERVGRITDFSTLKRHGIIVPDLTKYEGGDGLGHSTFATSPAFLKIFRQWLHRAANKIPRAN